jgi:hypothetical protein
MTRVVDLTIAAAVSIVAAGCGLSSGVTVATTAPATPASTLSAPDSTEAAALTPPPTLPTTAAPETSVASTDPATTPVTTPPTTPVTTTPATTTPVTSAPAGLAALDLLAMVRVEREHRGGYDRELFGYPTSFGGGCDTRDEVLQRDSLSPVQMDPVGCTVIAGDWYSPYDDRLYETPQDIEIDHVVALKEAWDSGAWQWSSAALEAFANDVTDPRTLRAVSGESNRQKSDKDPSNWLPENAADVCRFVADWTAIKVRWGLSMDESEFGRLRNLFNGPCAGTRIGTIAPTPVPVP